MREKPLKTEALKRTEQKEWHAKTAYLGGSDPTFGGFRPPNASGAEGRYRPSCRADFLAPSPAEVQADEPTESNCNHKRR